jgi:hypothetical protein
MKLERMCVVCGKWAVPAMVTLYNDPVCSCNCWKELQRIVSVMSDDTETDEEKSEQNTTFPSPILRDLRRQN